MTIGSPHPIGTAYENLRLGVRVRSQFNPSTSETTSVNLKFDQDIKLNLAAVPGTCTAASLSGDTIATAYEQCGPGAGGSRQQHLPVAGGQRERGRVDHGPTGHRRLHDGLQGG